MPVDGQAGQLVGEKVWGAYNRATSTPETRRVNFRHESERHCSLQLGIVDSQTVMRYTVA